MAPYVVPGPLSPSRGLPLQAARPKLPPSPASPASAVPRPPATAPPLVRTVRGAVSSAPTPTAAATRRRTQSLPTDAVGPAAALRAAAPPPADGGPPPSVDRALFRRLEEISAALAQLRRVAQSEHATASPELRVVHAELARLRRSARTVRASQMDVLAALAREEEAARAPLRKYLSPWLGSESGLRRKHMELKRQLSERAAEAVAVEDELARLERRSDLLADDWRRQSLDGVRPSCGSSLDEPELEYDVSESESEDDCTHVDMGTSTSVEEHIAHLEREKERVLEALLRALPLPDARRLMAHVATYASEAQACGSIAVQIDRARALYRHALQLLRMALASVVAASYSGSAKEFANGPFALAVEAGQLMEQAAHVVQPEARRRYRRHARDVLELRLPKFPTAVAEFARRARTNFDPRNVLALEAARRLPQAERALVLTHKAAIEKLEALDAWQQTVADDGQRAREAQQQLEDRLQTRLAVLARSLSV